MKHPYRTPRHATVLGDTQPHARRVIYASTLCMAAAVVACGGSSATGVPGAPVIGLARAGNASATIIFGPPPSEGGSAVASYRVVCSSGASSGEASGTGSPIEVTGLTNAMLYECSVSATNAAGTGASSSALAVTPSAAPSAPVTGSQNGTAGVLCGLSSSEYNGDESVNLTASYSWLCNTNSRVLSSNGVPNHEVGTFPGPGNPNAVAAIPTSATYTLTPAVAAGSTPVITSGYALNGVKMEPATAGACGDSGGSTCAQAGGTGTWSMEALGPSVFNFGTDDNNAHVQPNGAYHYHGMPEQFIAKLGKGTATMTLTGWAPDGFPIYARYGYNNASDAASGLKVLRGSYRLKAAADANRPSTTAYPMGSFTQDYQYAAGSGDLDECNGRTGATPEFPGGIYHYMITDTYPFIGRCVRGTAASIR